MRELSVAVVAAVLFFLGQAWDLPWLSLVTKGIPVIVLWWWLRRAADGLYRRWIGIGLLCSLAGDLLLDWPGDLFVPGLAAFLLAHLAYLRAYLSDCREPAIAALLGAAVVGASMFAVLATAGLGGLLIPVALYALAISAMLWRALARLGHAGLTRQSTVLAAAGGASFVLSDSLIGIDRFVAPFDAAPYAIMFTYWLGQWAITASAMHRTTAA
ncbi:lysoplasmalogenase [Pseudomonas sp.]|uniref:lysoplasmalogenase n=1 Tax=Pseudomonas sp. TaxID=306 RepID=UPI003D1069C1